LVQLYRHLLSRPPAEVDLLISRGFQINLDNSNNKTQHQPPPPYQGAQPNPPSYGVGNYPYPQSSGFVPVGYYGYQPSPYAPPPYPAGSGFKPPPSYPGSGAPPSYQEASSSHNELDELTSYLEALNVAELREILIRHNVRDAQSLITKEDLTSKIKQSCGVAILNELRTKNLAYQPAVPQPLAHKNGNGGNKTERAQQAEKCFKLYQDTNGPHQIRKEYALMLFSDFFKDKMDNQTLQDTARILLDNYDRSAQNGYVTLKTYLDIQERLLEMCV